MHNARYGKDVKLCPLLEQKKEREIQFIICMPTRNDAPSEITLQSDNVTFLLFSYRFLIFFFFSTGQKA